MPTFEEDMAFLSRHAQMVVLDGRRPAIVAVVPEWQGRVMTSSPTGPAGPGMGWINRPFIESGRRNTAFDNYGGEDRLWLGPEAGQFALFFKPKEGFDQSHWQTPPALHAGAFSVTGRSETSVAMAARMALTNYSGATFECALQRVIDVLTRDRMAAALGVTIPTGLSAVAFSSVNTLANVGPEPWKRQKGLLSLWLLGQFNPLPEGFVIAPHLGGPATKRSPMPFGDYFGAAPPERFALKRGYSLFKVDGCFRAKMGIAPGRACDIIASFDPRAPMLTIVQFNLPAAATLPYVNSRWEEQQDPYAGDAVNSYNDGSGAEKGFYELETSSPAAELGVNESIIHVHTTFHFTGPARALFRLGRDLLGVDLRKVRF